MTATAIYKTLQISRVDNTQHTYDVECNWRSSGWVWLARVVFDPSYETAMRITRGGLNLGEVAAVTSRIIQSHGRVFTVQL